jgi:hypothetical protein
MKNTLNVANISGLHLESPRRWNWTNPEDDTYGE